MKWVFIFSVDFDKINLDNDKNVDKDYPDTIIHAKLQAWHNKLEKCKALETDSSKELMPRAWHSTRCGEEIEPIFTDKAGVGSI